MSRLAIWAGLECTLNRVGDTYFDQCEKSGHLNRLEDLELFASLGVERVRYPCLWEKVAPEITSSLDWSWLDQRLERMKKLGVQPIAGLLHHGSGPRGTSLIDPQFPEKFTAYATAFAERFPWIEDYTPINEPLTTARFSCLYAIWYPHLRDDREFVRAVFNQAKATIMAMKAIREINPDARLIQTEDLGRAQSTAELKYQCDFENARRWLSFDLLCGRVDAKHELFKYLKKFGISEDEINWLRHNATPPDVLGLNHYLLSNRFLDHRLDLHPPHTHGGNGRHRYADVGAIDTPLVDSPPPEVVFREAWDRYQIPIAATEVHVRGYRESQMSWLQKIWRAASVLREEGVDFKAVTAWSLLGTYDWDSLCTQTKYFYEPGVFDLRGFGKKPKQTAISRLVQNLAQGGDCHHPFFELEGSLLITGGSGTLGRAFARICSERNIPFRILHRAEMDIADPESIERSLEKSKPWAIINTAGYVKVDQAESEKDLCYRENVVGAWCLARACASRGIPLVTFSSDLVFNGESTEAYTESHPVAPLNVYGMSKAECEHLVLQAHPSSLVIRTSSFFGPWDEHNFVTLALRRLQSGQVLDVPRDLRVSPTYVPDLVHATLDLLFDGEQGLIHLTNEGAITWGELARAAVSRAPRLDAGLIREMDPMDLGYRAHRPRNSALASERVQILPPLDDALNRYFLHAETLGDLL